MGNIEGSYGSLPLPGGGGGGGGGGGDDFSQDVRISQSSARVPDRVGRGVYSTGVVVLSGQHEFMLDFLLRLSSPQHVACRVIIPPTMMPLLIRALQDNIANFTSRFGPPPALPPVPPNQPRPPIEEVYEQLKVTDEVLMGAYANAMMVAHGPAEFCFDFICNGFPRSVVTARVYVAAHHAPRILESLQRSYDQRYPGSATPPAPPAPPMPPETR